MLNHHSLTHCSTNTDMRQKSHLVILGSFMFNFFICDRRVTKFTPKIDFKKKIIARKFQAKRATMTEIQLVQN